MTSKLIETASTCIPNKVINIRQGDLPWITNEIKKIMRKRDRLRRKAKKSNSLFHWSRFKLFRNKVVNLLRCAKKQYHESLCTRITQNKFSNKDWWKLVKHLSGFNNKTTEIKVLVDDNGTSFTDDIQKAELLNTFFTSQSTVDDTYGHIPILPDIVDQHSLEQIVISESDVLDILTTLDPTKAVGHDHVGPRLPKEAPNELSAPLCKLFNLSLNQKIFPTQWKRANVVPIFKKR